MQQPPSQDSTNQSAPLWLQSPYPQTDQTMPPRPLPANTYMQNYGQGEHPGEEASYGLVPQPPSGNYPAPYYPNPGDPPRPPKRRKAMTIVVLVLLALVIILGATTVLALRRPTTATPVTTVPTAPAQATSVPATPVPTATPAPTSGAATATPASSPGATAQPAATVATGTITENLLLTCGANCNDPIRVTITTVQVDDANGRMLWNVSLKNVTGSSIGYGVDTFELLASGAQTQIPATFSQSGGTLTNNDPSSIQGTFAFVPVQNTTYTLTIVVEVNPYGGPQINFDPVQITNL